MRCKFHGRSESMKQSIQLPFPHFSFKCKRCVNNIQTKLPPPDSDCTSDLSMWYHCSNNKGVPDTIVSQAWDVSKCISFMFHHRSSQAEVRPEEAVEKVGQKKKKKIYEDYDCDDEEDSNADDDSNDEDFVL